MVPEGIANPGHVGAAMLVHVAEARQLLEAEGIPVLVQSNAPGIFGAGFQGAVTGGIVLRVPSPELDRAASLLEADS